MAKDYKLCPNCNNALDLNANKCPYCGQQIIWLDLSKWKDWFVKVVENLGKSKDKKQTSGCAIIIIFFIAIQIIGAIFSLIFHVISSLF
jgi:RNA polymerase subunit RPABC4/transcription elongation factor Spt4